MEARCLNCRKEYKSKTSLFRFLASIGEYGYYCDKCFRKALIENGYGNIGTENMKTGKIYSIRNMSHKMLREVMYAVELRRINDIFSDKKKLEDASKYFLEKNPNVKKILEKKGE